MGSRKNSAKIETSNRIMSSKIFVLSFFVLLINSSASTESPSIKEIVAFVGDNACDCDIQVTVCGPDMDRCCTTNKLDKGGIDDFELGQADRFSGEVLGNCDGFVIENTDVFKLMIKHGGTDGLVVNVWKVQFNDGRKVFCEHGYIIDNEETQTLYCN